MPVIYGLFDPREPLEWKNCRYIGQTVSTPSHRLSQHIWDAERFESDSANRYIYRWIRKLLRDNIRPAIFVLEADVQWNVREREWIAFGRACGCRLTNGTDGGEGNRGFTPTAATREKQRQAKLGKSQTDQHRHNSSEAMRLAREVDPTILKKVSASLKSFYAENPEEREKISTRNKAWWNAHPEARESKGIERREYYEQHPDELRERNAKISKGHKEQDKSPTSCLDCDAGPFKGTAGMRRHAALVHRDTPSERLPLLCECGAGPFAGRRGLSAHTRQIHKINNLN